MKISVVLPTLGIRIKEIERFFNSLKKQTYQNFNVIVVCQANHDRIQQCISSFIPLLEIKLVKVSTKGLSKARNTARSYIDGDISILADDDCWYPCDAFEKIKQAFIKRNYEIICFQIYDPLREEFYKKYKSNENADISKLAIMSKSSIEIAVRMGKNVNFEFDEKFGLGTELPASEEAEFLLKNKLLGVSIGYMPSVIVYHEKKNKSKIKSSKRYFATGAVYAKYFGLASCMFSFMKNFVIRRDYRAPLILIGYVRYKLAQLNLDSSL